MSRLSLDNDIIGFECLHALGVSKWNEGSFALKLDMSKAYDLVEWGFLANMIRKIGFSNNWVAKVIRCVSSVSFSFVINGKVCGKIKPSRVDIIKTNSGGWDVPKVHECFLKDDVDFILSIPSSISAQKDALLWHFDKNDDYSVKSGYRFPETNSHALWGCPKLKKVRSSCDFMKEICCSESMHFQDILLLCVGRTPSSDIGIVIHDILSCVEGGLIRVFQFVPTKANMVDHNLAETALSIKSDLLWVEYVPPFVEALVLEDFSL
ncbi:hypothetical protein Dsin_015653 [Dipteronia sinensis]|uniref:Reverse transcriptase domain-containing protein n=1 Tax=Dipteronia sinensis TaxID=43782 RepID=A0AAE0ACV7_9ROSI|nr:hypothetical protein Dsin_015653 [Dipteronia sinensis]